MLFRSLGSLDAVKTAAIVVDATAGIQLMTRRMMDWAKERNLNRILIVNKIDAEHVDLPKLIEELKEAFGNEVMPINLPANNGARVIDCFAKDHGEADFLSVEEVHRQFIEQVVEVDDEAMEKYLEEGNADPSTLHGPLTQALREGHIIPICFVSGKTGAGVDDLINEHERSELLHRIIAAQPEIQRRRYLLYYEYDFNYYEIAAMEHCTAQAVRRSVVLAKEKIKAQMKKYLCP